MQGMFRLFRFHHMTFACVFVGRLITGVLRKRTQNNTHTSEPGPSNMTTPIVIQQQPVAVPRITEWNTGLCHCCQDMDSCCCAFWCLPCFACKTTSKFGESKCLPLVDIFGPAIVAFTGVGLCVPPVTLSMRVAVRYKYQIQGSLCEDILISCFCVCCSWTQMYREIKHRKLTEPRVIHTVTATCPSHITIPVMECAPQTVKM